MSDNNILRVNTFDAMVFGDNLKRLLKERGISGAELSKIMGVSTVTVSNWCTGRKIPDDSNKCELASILGVTLDELMPTRQIEIKRGLDVENILKKCRKHWDGFTR